MCRVAATLCTLMLLGAQSLPAQTSGMGQALVLPLAGDVDASHMARVVTGSGQPAECIAPLAVTRIDGQARTVPAQGFLIEPGLHAINGRATLDLSACPLGDPGLTIGAVSDLEVEFVAGGTYYIGFHYPPGRPGEWKLTVWNIEANPAIDQLEQ